MALEAAAFGRLATPIIKDIYEGAKKFGVRGLHRWEAKGFAAKMGRRIKALESVRTLWKPEAISLMDFFHPPKLIINGKPSFIGRLSELPANLVVIEGIVGQGKSVFLRSLAIQEIGSNEAKRLPVLVDLKDLSSKLDLRQAVLRQLESYDIDVDDDTLNYLYRSGKVTLLLDGFDEIEENSVKSVYLEIEHLGLRFPDLQIVVSSRPGREIQKSSNFRNLPIAQLTQSEFSAFLTKLGVGAEKSISIRQAIKNSPSKISNLITTPLMLTLVVIVYEAESQIPETLPEFFDRLFQTVFSRHDRIKAAFTRKHYSGLSEKSLQRLFEAFCFMSLQSGHGRTISQSQFDEIFDHACEYADQSNCDSMKFKQDIVQVACLMLEDGVDSYTFLHKSIVEYYAAAFVRSLGDNNAKMFYSSTIEKSSGWEETLRFLRSIDSFRYFRDYVIPIVNAERTEVLASIVDNSNESIISTFKRLYPGLGVYFRMDAETKGAVKVSAYGSIIERSADNLTGLGFLLMDALAEMTINVNTIEELNSQFNAHPEHAIDDLGVHVPGEALLRAYGTVEVRKAFDLYKNKLDKLADEANEIVGKENKKSLIFSRRQPKSEIG